MDHAFFDDAKTIVAPWNADAAMCSDPRRDVASAVCCDDEGNTKKAVSASVYAGKRVTYGTNVERCGSAGGVPCDVTTVAGDSTTRRDAARSKKQLWGYR